MSLPQVTLSSLSEQQAVALQQRALSLLTDTQPSFVDTLINIYQLDSLDPSILRLHIVRLQALNCYKEVSASEFFLWFYLQVKLMLKKKDLHFVFFTGSSAQHKAEVTERTEYGGGETKYVSILKMCEIRMFLNGLFNKSNQQPIFFHRCVCR